jgi:hypothetical protein
MFTNRKQRASIPRDSLVREIAERSVAPTLAQLRGNADNMSPAELRGYVQAHALAVVRDEATLLVSRAWPTMAFAELVAAALEQTTHLVVLRLKSPPVVTVPTSHVRLRRAA